MIPEYDVTLLKSTHNLQGVELRFAPNFSVRDALNAHKIVIVQAAIAKIESVWMPGGPGDSEVAGGDGPELTETAAGEETVTDSAEVTA